MDGQADRRRQVSEKLNCGTRGKTGLVPVHWSVLTLKALMSIRIRVGERVDASLLRGKQPTLEGFNGADLC